MLKLLLMRFFALEPLWKSQILIQIIAMLDLGKALIIWKYDARMVFSNM